MTFLFGRMPGKICQKYQDVLNFQPDSFSWIKVSNHLPKEIMTKGITTVMKSIRKFCSTYTKSEVKDTAFCKKAWNDHCYDMSGYIHYLKKRLFAFEFQNVLGETRRVLQELKDKLVVSFIFPCPWSKLC